MNIGWIAPSVGITLETSNASMAKKLTYIAKRNVIASKKIQIIEEAFGKLKCVNGIKTTTKILRIPTKKTYDFGFGGPAKTNLSPKKEKLKNK